MKRILLIITMIVMISAPLLEEKVVKAYDYDFNLLSTDVNYKKTGSFPKNTFECVWVKGKVFNGTLSSVYVKVYGTNSDSSAAVDCTHNNRLYYYSTINKDYKLYNDVRENGYIKACIGLRGRSGTGYVEGNWNPDLSGTAYVMPY